MPRRFHLIVSPPGDVEAIQVTPEKVDRAALWVGGVKVIETDPFDSSLKFVALNVPTENGVIRVPEDWWIIKRADGALEKMGPEEFAATYEMSVDNGK